MSLSDWKKYDTGSDKVILVGPVMHLMIAPEILKSFGLDGATQVAIDGGLHYAPNPALSVGDGDSSKGPPDIFKPSQDKTDLRFCLNGIRNWAWREMHAFGFIGGRRDHELANFGELDAEMRARPAFTRAVIYDSALHPQVWMCNKGAHEIELSGRFSVLVLKETRVTISGACDYPATDLTLQPLSGRGVSNRANGAVRFTADGPFMVFAVAEAAGS